MEKFSFTKVNLILLSCCPTVHRLYPYITCSTWGILVSFNLAYILNPKAMIKFNEKQNNKLFLGNVITHLIPATFTLIFPPKKKMKLRNGIGAAAIHLTWGAWVSGGTLILNKQYYNLPNNHWYILWFSAILTELLTPKIFNKIYSLKN